METDVGISRAAGGASRAEYPGDPPLYPLAQTQLRDELIIFYDHEIVAVFQPDGSFEACRMN